MGSYIYTKLPSLFWFRMGLSCLFLFSQNTLIQTYKKFKALKRETKASFRVSPQANNHEYDGTIINKSKAV